MQQFIDFIIRKKNVLIYFLLLSFSLLLVFQTNFFQKSKIIVFSNSTANYFNEMFNNLNGYFNLRRVNSELVNENLFLKNQLENVINKKQLDSLENAIFKYQNAKVISNSLSSFKNYLIIVSAVPLSQFKCNLIYQTTISTKLSSLNIVNLFSFPV